MIPAQNKCALLPRHRSRRPPFRVFRILHTYSSSRIPGTTCEDLWDPMGSCQELQKSFSALN